VQGGRKKRDFQFCFSDDVARITITPGPVARQHGVQIAELLGLFQGRVPDATSNASGLKLAVTPDRWSAGHALFDILNNRLLVAESSW
jgi:hypothetical protein